MRVIAGTLKGRRLRSPQWSGLRPTSDRLRETLFNVLGDRVRGASVLDACAGTGAVGIEALSRGARTVVFIESDRRATALIIQNLKACGRTEPCTVICGVLPGRLTRSDVLDRFDLILLDPPYADLKIGAILAGVGGSLATDGCLVLERTRRSRTPIVAGLRHVRMVTSGDSVLDFYNRISRSPEGKSE
jgi:16S rRNA (guanine966-N2)-methyltransferase